MHTAGADKGADDQGGDHCSDQKCHYLGRAGKHVLENYTNGEHARAIAIRAGRLSSRSHRGLPQRSQGHRIPLPIRNLALS